MANRTPGGARNVVRAADLLSSLLSRIGIAVSGVAMLVSLTLVAYGVAMRYALNQPQTWLDELVGYLLVATVMLGASDALRQREHIAIDIVVGRLDAGKRFWVAVVALASVIATALLFIVEGWETMSFSRMVDLRSTGYLDAPLWTIQLLIPLGGAILLLNALTLLLRLLLRDLAVDEVVPLSDPTQLPDGRERGS